MLTQRLRDALAGAAAALAVTAVAGLGVWWWLQPPAAKPEPALVLDAASFDDLPGWADDDHAAALASFNRSCAAILAFPDDRSMRGSGYAGTAADWKPACAEAHTLDPGSARSFFERAFTPVAVSDNGEASGLFTGYYEPELRIARTRGGEYQTPIWPRPKDLVSVELGDFRDGLRGQRIAGRVVDQKLVPFPDRAAIVGGALDTAETPIAFAADPFDVFNLEIQGSGRGVLPDGSTVRLAYAGQNGHSYVAVGGVLIREEGVPRSEMSMQRIRRWVRENPDRGQALMNRNPSYVFFKEEPLADPTAGAAGAKGVSLSTGRSLAVDLKFHSLGVPVFLDATAPAPQEGEADVIFRRLMIAQDTGGAIRGPVRGDVYWGAGAQAESVAGRMKHQGRYWLLLPTPLAARAVAPES